MHALIEDFFGEGSQFVDQVKTALKSLSTGKVKRLRVISHVLHEQLP
jgi:hypothetical protein